MHRVLDNYRANYALLKSWGVADNQKGETRAVTTFMDRLCSINRDIMEVNQRFAEAKISKKQAKAKLKTLSTLREHRGLE